jgi:hypothetical protein
LHNSDDITAMNRKMELIAQKLDSVIDILRSLNDKSDGEINDWITVEEASRISGLGRTKLYHLRKAGQLEYSSLTGKEKFIRKSSLFELLNRNQFNLQNTPLIGPRRKKND